MDIAGWEKMYRSGERGREDAPTILLVEVAGKLAPGIAIDLACGAGRTSTPALAPPWSLALVLKRALLEYGLQDFSVEDDSANSARGNICGERVAIVVRQRG